jgi:hypothetical protein
MSTGVHDAGDDFVSIKTADVINDPAHLTGLHAQNAFGQDAQVEPNREGQSQQPENDGGDERRFHRFLMAGRLGAQLGHGLTLPPRRASGPEHAFAVPPFAKAANLDDCPARTYI